MLKYLHEELNCEWNVWTIIKANQYAAYECLVYAIDNGCEKRYWLERSPDTRPASYAAKANNLEELKYSVENGCTISNYVKYNSEGPCWYYIDHIYDEIRDEDSKKFAKRLLPIEDTTKYKYTRVLPYRSYYIKDNSP